MSPFLLDGVLAEEWPSRWFTVVLAVIDPADQPIGLAAAGTDDIAGELAAAQWSRGSNLHTSGGAQPPPAPPPP